MGEVSGEVLLGSVLKGKNNFLKMNNVQGSFSKSEKIKQLKKEIGAINK